MRDLDYYTSIASMHFGVDYSKVTRLQRDHAKSDSFLCSQYHKNVESGRVRVTNYYKDGRFMGTDWKMVSAWMKIESILAQTTSCANLENLLVGLLGLTTWDILPRSGLSKDAKEDHYNKIIDSLHSLEIEGNIISRDAEVIRGYVHEYLYVMEHGLEGR